MAGGTWSGFCDTHRKHYAYDIQRTEENGAQAYEKTLLKYRDFFTLKRVCYPNAIARAYTNQFGPNGPDNRTCERLLNAYHVII